MVAKSPHLPASSSAARRKRSEGWHPHWHPAWVALPARLPGPQPTGGAPAPAWRWEFARRAALSTLRRLVRDHPPTPFSCVRVVTKRAASWFPCRGGSGGAKRPDLPSELHQRRIERAQNEFGAGSGTGTGIPAAFEHVTASGFPRRVSGRDLRRRRRRARRSFRRSETRSSRAP